MQQHLKYRHLRRLLNPPIFEIDNCRANTDVDDVNTNESHEPLTAAASRFSVPVTLVSTKSCMRGMARGVVKGVRARATRKTGIRG